MDFSIRLARAAAVMTWVSLVFGVLTAVLMDRVGAMPGVHVHLTAVYLWAVFGAVVTTLLTFLPKMAMSSHFVLKNITAFRAFLLIADTVWITANVKETRLGRVAVGDTVEFTVDGYGARAFCLRARATVHLSCSVHCVGCRSPSAASLAAKTRRLTLPRADR